MYFQILNNQVLLSMWQSQDGYLKTAFFSVNSGRVGYDHVV